jgi:hypothetical protein
MLLNQVEINAVLATMTPMQKLEFLSELEEQERRIGLKKAQTSMTDFARMVYPGFKEGPHHRKAGENLQRCSRRGQKARDYQYRAPYG